LKKEEGAIRRKETSKKGGSELHQKNGEPDRVKMEKKKIRASQVLI